MNVCTYCIEDKRLLMWKVLLEVHTQRWRFILVTGVRAVDVVGFSRFTDEVRAVMFGIPLQVEVSLCLKHEIVGLREIVFHGRAVRGRKRAGIQALEANGVPVPIWHEVLAYIVGSLVKIVLVVFSLVNGQLGVFVIIRDKRIIVAIGEFRGIVRVNA